MTDRLIRQISVSRLNRIQKQNLYQILRYSVDTLPFFMIVLSSGRYNIARLL